MKVIGIIPSRYASSRFPGKPLIDLKGKSMIQRVYEACNACGLFSRLIVATDDQRIFDHVQSFGGEVMMTSSEHRSGTDRCGEVINSLMEAYDVVVNIQGDEPLVKCEQLQSLVNCFVQLEVEIATLAIKGLSYEEAQNKNRVKVVVNAAGEALYFSRSPIPYQANKEGQFTKHIGLYAFRSDTLKQLVKLAPSDLELTESLEQLRWMDNGYAIQVAYTAVETPNIDVPEDVKKVLSLI